jgi:hypothetical protein
LIIFVSHVSIASDNIAWGCSVFKLLNGLELPARQFVKRVGEPMSETHVMLDVIDVRTPCPASWHAMAGDARSRFCEHCGLHVHNLSAMTLDEAQRLVCERAGRQCVRFERDAEGRIVTLDYAVRRRNGSAWWFWGSLAAVLGLAGALVRALLWQAPTPPPAPVMGDVTVGSVLLPTDGPDSSTALSLDSPTPRS